jgi:hypothetical protein
MKIISSLALALFLSSADAFGPAAPVNGNAFGVSTQSRSGDMTMRVGTIDMVRRQKFNDVLERVGGLASKEAVQTQLLSPETSRIVEKSNWKIRKFMLRKIRALATKYDVEVPSKFGVPLTPEERMAAEKVAGAARSVEKVAVAAARAETEASEKAIRAAKTAEKKGKNDKIAV